MVDLVSGASVHPIIVYLATVSSAVPVCSSVTAMISSCSVRFKIVVGILARRAGLVMVTVMGMLVDDVVPAFCSRCVFGVEVGDLCDFRRTKVSGVTIL